MPFIPTPGMAMLTVNYLSNDGVVAINRLYCGVADPVTEEQLEEITEAAYDVWVAQVCPYMSNHWQMTGMVARALNEAEGLQHIDTNSYPVAGGVNDSISPPSQVSYTVTLNTGLVGRSARGRIYGVGLSPTMQNGVRLIDGARNDLQSGWNLVRSAMVAAGHALNVVSFEEGGVPRAAGRPLPVLSVNVRFPLATQRRRLS